MSRAASSLAFALVFLTAACGRTSSPGAAPDGAVGAGGGGSAGSTGGSTMGRGGGTSRTLPGTGGGVGSGGDPRTGGSIGTGGAPASGGAGGTNRDAAAPDLPRDLATDEDVRPSGDAVEGCGPGYPLGSTRPAADGCNSCVCNAGGIWTCTLLICPRRDAAADQPEQDAARDLPATDGSGTACSEMKTLEACDTRDDCHTVLADTSRCSCVAPGCCAVFDFCADGALADCRGPASCKRMEPTCEPDFVVAYEDSCYEGCVRPAECAP